MRDDEKIFTDAIKLILEDYHRRWRLAEVIAFNKELGEVDVKVLGFVRNENNRILGKDDNGKPVDVVFNNIPVRIFGNEDNFMIHSIKVGSICELQKIDYDISDYIADGEPPENGFTEDISGENWVAVFTLRHNLNPVTNWKEGIEMRSKENSFFISEIGEALLNVAKLFEVRVNEKNFFNISEIGEANMKVEKFFKIQNKFDVLAEGLSLLGENIATNDNSATLVGTLSEMFKSVASGFKEIAGVIGVGAGAASAIEGKEKDLQSCKTAYSTISGNIKKIKA